MGGFGPWDEEIASALGSITSPSLSFPCACTVCGGITKPMLFFYNWGIQDLQILLFMWNYGDVKYIKYTWNWNNHYYRKVITTGSRTPLHRRFWPSLVNVVCDSLGYCRQFITGGSTVDYCWSDVSSVSDDYMINLSISMHFHVTEYNT